MSLLSFPLFLATSKNGIKQTEFLQIFCILVPAQRKIGARKSSFTFQLSQSLFIYADGAFVSIILLTTHGLQ